MNLYQRTEGEMTLTLSAMARRSIDVLPVEGQEFTMKVDNYNYKCRVKSIDGITKNGNFVMTFTYVRVEDEAYCSKCGRRYREKDYLDHMHS